MKKSKLFPDPNKLMNQQLLNPKSISKKDSLKKMMKITLCLNLKKSSKTLNDKPLLLMNHLLRKSQLH